MAIQLFVLLKNRSSATVETTNTAGIINWDYGFVDGIEVINIPIFITENSKIIFNAKVFQFFSQERKDWEKMGTKVYCPLSLSLFGVSMRNFSSIFFFCLRWLHFSVLYGPAATRHHYPFPRKSSRHWRPFTERGVRKICCQSGPTWGIHPLPTCLLFREGRVLYSWEVVLANGGLETFSGLRGSGKLRIYRIHFS